VSGEALKEQDADIDRDVAGVLQFCIADRLGNQIERLGKPIAARSSSQCTLAWIAPRLAI